MRTGRLAQRGVTTFAGQGAVPRLPVPAVNATLARWLRSLEPLVPPSVHSEAVAHARAFETDPFVSVLQQRLQQRAAHHDNWLEEW
jgi:carnitine O-acetyltransferase